MFNSRALKEFEEDPFFSGFSSPFFSLEDGRKNNKGRVNRLERQEFPFGNIFNGMQKMMNDISSQMGNMDGDPNSHCYSSSTVMSYRNDGRSKPKIVQASRSTRMAPGQIAEHQDRMKETRRTFRDSESGVEKMAIGRHLGHKSHEIERRRLRGGDIEEETHFNGLDEDELPHFEHEWKQRAHHSYSKPTHGRRSNHRIETGRHDDRARVEGEREDRSLRRVSERRPTGPGRSGRH